MSHPCPQVLGVLYLMEYYNTPTRVLYAEGPDNVGQVQRRLAESPVEGVEVEGEFQWEQAQFQPQIEEVSHDDRRGARDVVHIVATSGGESPVLRIGGIACEGCCCRI